MVLFSLNKIKIMTFATVASIAMVRSGHYALAAEISFLCAEALESAVRELVPEFEQARGHTVKLFFANVGANTERVRNGSDSDLAIVLPQQWEVLHKEAKIDPGVRVVIGKVGIGAFVKKGATRPDIGSVAAFTDTLLRARSIAIRDPSQRSPVGTYMLALFDRLGIGGEIKSKIVLTADRPYRAVIDRNAEIGFSTMAEIVASPEVDLVGPLPAAIQNFNILTAAIPVNSKQKSQAKALVDFLISERANSMLKSKGIEPG